MDLSDVGDGFLVRTVAVPRGHSVRPLAPEISAGRGMPEWKSDELTITVKSCVQPPSYFNRGYLFLRHEPDLIL